MHIVYIEDNPPDQDVVARFLRSRGHEVTIFSTVPDAVQFVLEVQPDVLLCDYWLKGETNSLVLVERVRNLYPSCPIVMVSYHADVEDVSRSIEIGIDAHVKRPVGLIELLDKIYAAIERRQRSALPLPSAVITSGLLTLDTVQRAATWAGEPLNLTANEFRVLTQLVSNPGRVYTPVDLYASFGGERLPHHVARNLIKQYIFKLRAKLEQKGKYPLQIVAVRGQGYKWVDAESDSA